MQGVVRQYIAPPFMITFNFIDFSDLSYFGDIGENYIPILVLGSLGWCQRCVGQALVDPQVSLEMDAGDHLPHPAICVSG